MHPGAFIVLDGPDGTGTTTHSALLAERLTTRGRKVLLTREPTDGPIGTSIREFLTGKTDLTPSALQLLFCADRSWHVEHVIEPAIKKGIIVICDRYVPSTLVYAAAQKLDVAWLTTVNAAFRSPDCVIFTLPPAGVGIKRISSRKDKELFETRDFQERIHEGYLRMAKENTDIRVVDTSGEKEAVADAIEEAVSETLMERGMTL